MSQCVDEGRLRAYLDGELLPIERAAIGAHIASCANCQAQQQRQRALAARVRTLLPISAGQPDPRAALTRLRATNNHLSQRSQAMPSTSFWSSQRRALLAGLAAVIAVLSLLALPPVRAVADELLSVFRVQNVVFLPVSSDRLQQLANLNFDKNTLFVTKPTAEHPVAPRSVASAAEATSAVGYPVAQPSALPSAPLTTEFQVNDPNKTQFQINVASARQLLTLMGIDDVTLPDALGASPIVVDVPAFAAIHYHGQNYDITLHQGHSPNVTLPEGVDLAQLGKATLRLLGMTPQEAEATSQTINWNNTLLFPFPKDTSAIRQVPIGNATGMLVSGGGRRQQHWQLYWQSGDKLYMLQASGTLSDAEMIAALTAAAESVN